MVGNDELVDIEGDAELIRGLAGCHGAPAMARLCELLTGQAPLLARQPQEGRYVGGRVLLRHGLSNARSRFIIGHELSHWWYERRGYDGPDLEERCDALGAALVAPWHDFKAATKILGHAVHALADAFNVTQSLALLRVGEVCGRPVALLRWPEAIVRGAEFEWPSTSALVRALRERPTGVHPIRITDEPGKWGLMASN